MSIIETVVATVWVAGLAVITIVLVTGGEVWTIVLVLGVGVTTIVSIVPGVVEPEPEPEPFPSIGTTEYVARATNDWVGCLLCIIKGNAVDESNTDRIKRKEIDRFGCILDNTSRGFCLYWLRAASFCALQLSGRE